MKKIVGILFLFIWFISSLLSAQTINVKISGGSVKKALLYKIQGEKTLLLDSTNVSNSDEFAFEINSSKQPMDIYRLSFDKHTWLDFINDGKDVSLSTSANNVLDSLQIIKSESNKLFYTFLKLISIS